MIQRKESGFTLVEIVVTLIILGVLAAFAFPRFANTSTDARKSAANTLFGTLKSAASLAHSVAVIQSQTGVTGNISMENVNVSMVFGYPAVASGGINNALGAFDNFTYAGGVFSQTGAPTPATCGVTYAQSVAANALPTYTLNQGGC